MDFTLTYFRKTFRNFSFLLFLNLSCLISFSQPITFEKYYDLGGNYGEEAYCVQPTFDGGYIIAGRQGISFTLGTRLLLQKVDSAGQTQWYKSIGSPGTQTLAYSVKQTTDSGYVMTGLHFDVNGNYSIYIAKTNVSGDTTWTKKYVLTNQNAMTGNDLLQTSDGGYLVLCDVVDSINPVWTPYLIKINSNGDSLWTKKYPRGAGLQAGCIKPTSDGGYIIPTYTNPSSNDNSVYLIKTDANCDTLWTKLIQRPMGYNYLLDRTNCINQTSDGGFFIAGTIWDTANTSNTHIAIIKTNSTGDTLWTKKIGTGSDKHWGDGGGFQTSDGGYIIAGTIEHITTTGDADVYLVKTNGTGVVQWAKTFGGTIHEWANFIMPTQNGGFIITGTETSWGDGMGVYLIKTDSTGYAPSGIDFISFVPTEMLIYPNPFSFSATVKIISPEIKNGTFILHDSFARIVKQMKVETSQFEIHKENLPAGIYLCAFVDSEGKIISQTKIIIQ